MIAPSFKERVLTIVREIPKGRVLSYGEVAKCAGSPQAFRAVGTVLAKNEDVSVPCHRVIRSDGHAGTYNGLQGKSKEAVLRSEGVIFDKNNKVVV
ncbi:MAG: MGMT family protein [Candidatus Paceibacterota bacterium]